MYLGRVVEIGPTPRLISYPQHPYTKALLSAIPEADPVATRGKVRVATAQHGRAEPAPCPARVARSIRVARSLSRGYAMAAVPQLVGIGDGVQIACHVVAREHGVG